MRARPSPASLPVYLNALAGKGVHVVTTQRLPGPARRRVDGPGAPVPRPHRRHDPAQRRRRSEHRAAYRCDITYGTNNEFGFDYLRDNMAWSNEELVQRGHNFAIVDEVDSILIDEARTPLIISGPAEQSAKWYGEFARVVKRLESGKADKDGGRTTTSTTRSTSPSAPSRSPSAAWPGSRTSSASTTCTSR